MSTNQEPDLPNTTNQGELSFSSCSSDVLRENVDSIDSLNHSKNPSEIFEQFPESKNINLTGNPIISGFDVKSLYPSLRDIDTACLAREAILHSDIKFEGIDFQRALAYLRIVAGIEAMKMAGLSNLIPI